MPEGMSLQVISVHGGEFSVVPENGQATMPLGDYIVRHWVFEKTDTEGKVIDVSFGYCDGYYCTSSKHLGH